MFDLSVRTLPPTLRASTAIFVLAFILSGCGEGQTERVPLGDVGPAPELVEALPAALQERIDAANEAYRAQDYERALELFRAVTEAEPELAVGWYGVGMTHAAMGNRAAADSAMSRVHLLAPELPLIHPGAEAPPNPHPAPTGD